MVMRVKMASNVVSQGSKKWQAAEEEGGCRDLSGRIVNAGVGSVAGGSKSRALRWRMGQWVF